MLRCTCKLVSQINPTKKFLHPCSYNTKIVWTINFVSTDYIILGSRFQPKSGQLSPKSKQNGLYSTRNL